MDELNFADPGMPFPNRPAHDPDDRDALIAELRKEVELWKHQYGYFERHCDDSGAKATVDKYPQDPGSSFEPGDYIDWLREQLSSERETSKKKDGEIAKLKRMAGESTGDTEFDRGWLAHKMAGDYVPRAELLEEREKARKLVEAAKQLCGSVEDGFGDSAIRVDAAYLRDALKPYATETGASTPYLRDGSPADPEKFGVVVIQGPPPAPPVVVRSLLKALRWALEKDTVCRCFKDSICTAHHAIDLAEIYLGK